MIKFMSLAGQKSQWQYIYSLLFFVPVSKNAAVCSDSFGGETGYEMNCKRDSSLDCFIVMSQSCCMLPRKR